MPYRVKGPDVYHKKNGKWVLKQHCTSNVNAIKAVRLLHMKGFGAKGK